MNSTALRHFQEGLLLLLSEICWQDQPDTKLPNTMGLLSIIPANFGREPIGSDVMSRAVARHEVSYACPQGSNEQLHGRHARIEAAVLSRLVRYHRMSAGADIEPVSAMKCDAETHGLLFSLGLCLGI